MNLVLRQSVFSHIMRLGWTWGENLLLSMSTIWLYYNSLTEQLLSLSCWAKCSLCIISLNHYSKTFGTVTALFPTLQSVLYKQMISTKERSKMGNWKFCRQFGFSRSLFSLGTNLPHSSSWFPWKQDFCSMTSASLPLAPSPDNFLRAHGFSFSLGRFIFPNLQFADISLLTAINTPPTAH